VPACWPATVEAGFTGADICEFGGHWGQQELVRVLGGSNAVLVHRPWACLSAKEAQPGQRGGGKPSAASILGLSTRHLRVLANGSEAGGPTSGGREAM